MLSATPFELVARWFHVGAVIILVGGTVFMRFVLHPSATAALSSDAHAALRDKIIGRWKFFVHTLIGLLLISGLYTMIVKIKSMPPLWHALFGVKFLLAMAIFFIASVLVGRSAGMAKVREQRPFWLVVVIVMATIVVLISSVMRFISPKAAPATEPAKTVTALVSPSSTFLLG